MMQIYQGKSTRGADGGGYTIETLRQAIEAVKDQREIVSGTAKNCK